MGIELKSVQFNEIAPDGEKPNAVLLIELEEEGAVLFDGPEWREGGAVSRPVCFPMNKDGVKREVWIEAVFLIDISPQELKLSITSENEEVMTNFKVVGDPIIDDLGNGQKEVTVTFVGISLAEKIEKKEIKFHWKNEDAQLGFSIHEFYFIFDIPCQPMAYPNILNVMRLTMTWATESKLKTKIEIVKKIANQIKSEFNLFASSNSWSGPYEGVTREVSDHFFLQAFWSKISSSRFNGRFGVECYQASYILDIFLKSLGLKSQLFLIKPREGFDFFCTTKVREVGEGISKRRKYQDHMVVEVENLLFDIFLQKPVWRGENESYLGKTRDKYLRSLISGGRGRRCDNNPQLIEVQNLNISYGEFLSLNRIDILEQGLTGFDFNLKSRGFQTQFKLQEVSLGFPHDGVNYLFEFSGFLRKGFLSVAVIEFEDAKSAEQYMRTLTHNSMRFLSGSTGESLVSKDGQLGIRIEDRMVWIYSGPMTPTFISNFQGKSINHLNGLLESIKDKIKFNYKLKTIEIDTLCGTRSPNPNCDIKISSAQGDNIVLDPCLTYFLPKWKPYNGNVYKMKGRDHVLFFSLGETEDLQIPVVLKYKQYPNQGYRKGETTFCIKINTTR